MDLILYLKRKVKGFWRVHKQQGLARYLIGHIKLPYYRYLQRKYDFDQWHITPYELRPYAVDIVRYMNMCNRKKGKINTVCEVGCGLGDILRNVHAKEKIGVDLSDEVIQGARKLDKRASYYTGGFDKLCEVAPKNIDVLVTVNFIHNIESQELERYYKMIIDGRNVKKIIVDTVDAAGYRYKHDFRSLLLDYKIEECIFEYGGRKVLVLKQKV